MKRPSLFRPEDQAVVDQFRAMLAAVRAPEPWTPGRAQDVAALLADAAAGVSA